MSIINTIKKVWYTKIHKVKIEFPKNTKVEFVFVKRNPRVVTTKTFLLDEHWIDIPVSYNGKYLLTCDIDKNFYLEDKPHYDAVAKNRSRVLAICEIKNGKLKDIKWEK